MSVKVMGMVWDLNIGRDEKLVLLAYADHADHEGCNVYPSVKTIARKTGYSERSVQAITRNLEKAGILVADGSGPQGTNRWKVVIYGGADSAGGCNPLHRGGEAGCTGGVQPTAPEPSFNHQLTNTTRGDIFKVYEQEIGILTPMIADSINDYLDEPRCPNQWIIDAIREAAHNQKRNWKYIEAILKRWMNDGAQTKFKLPNTPKYRKSIQEQIAEG